MTARATQAVDLHGFALREFLDFVRKEDPSWIEGAQVRRSDEGQHRSGVVDGKLWVEVLVASFAEGKTGPEHWVGEIEKVSLAAQ